MTMDSGSIAARPDKFTLLLAISFFAFIVIGAIPGVLNIAWTYMQGTFTVSNDSLGILLSASTVGRLITAFLSGRIIGQTGVGKFILGGSLVSAIGVLGYASVPSFPTLLIAAFIASLGIGMIDAGINSFASNYVGRGLMNWLHAFFGVGLTIGPIIVTYLVEELGQTWRSGYIVMFLLQIVLSVAVFLTLKSWKLPIDNLVGDEKSESKKQAATLRETLMVPAVMISVVLFAVYGGVEIGTGQLLNTLLVDGRDISQETSSKWISFYWGTFTVARMIIGTLGDRISNIVMMRVSLIGVVMGMFMLWVNLNSIMSILALAVIGFSLAPLFATLISETPRRVGPRNVANAIGFQLGFAGLGGALLPGVAGVLVDWFEPEIIAPFLFFNAILLLVLHEVILFRESRKRLVIAGD